MSGGSGKVVSKEKQKLLGEQESEKLELEDLGRGLKEKKNPTQAFISKIDHLGKKNK